MNVCMHAYFMVLHRCNVNTPYESLNGSLAPLLYAARFHCDYRVSCGLNEMIASVANL